MLNNKANTTEERKTRTNGSYNHHNSHRTQNKDVLIEVWKRTLRNWNPFDDNVVKPALILAYSYPIPMEVRSNVWFVISGARDLMSKNRSVFDHLCQRSSKCSDVIEKDLKRTFVDKDTNLKYEHTLRRILVGFSNFDPQIGYTQGMNYIAGFILIQYFELNKTEYFNDFDCFDDETETEYEFIKEKRETQLKVTEEKSFWTFVAIMNKIGTLFSDRLPGFHKSVECFKNVFNYHGPTALVRHLNELNVYPIMLSGWYHSLFTYPSMHKTIAKRIWDVFLCEQLDFSAILRISYLTVVRHETKLMNMDFVQIIEFTKSRKCFMFNDKDDHDLIYRSSKLQLNETYLKPIRHLKYIDLHSLNQNNGFVNANASVNATASANVKDSIFDNHNSYKNLGISDTSVHSSVSSSSSSYVKLKSSNNRHIPPPKDNVNASKSWTNLLTFGFVK